MEGRHRLAAVRRHRQPVGPRPRRPADPAAAARRRSGSAWGRGRSARTAAVRSGSRPAFTGTVALKPTYGLIPLYPPSPFGTLSHAGPMTRTVRDTAALLDVITGFDARDWSAMPTPTTSFLRRTRRRRRRPAHRLLADLGFVRNDPEVEAAVRAAVDVLADAGRRGGRGRSGIRRSGAGLPRAVVLRGGQGAAGLRRHPDAWPTGSTRDCGGPRRSARPTRRRTTWTRPPCGWSSAG